MVSNLFKIQFSTKKFLSKISHKNAYISTFAPKTKFEWFIPTPDGYAFVQNAFPTINFSAKFFINVHRFRRIHQKLNSKGFFRT